MDDRLSEQTLSHASRRPQLLRFLAAAVCSQVFFFFSSPLWGSPTRHKRPSHFMTEQNEATQRFTMWPDLQAPLGRASASKYFYGSKNKTGGRRI